MAAISTVQVLSSSMRVRISVHSHCPALVRFGDAIVLVEAEPAISAGQHGQDQPIAGDGIGRPRGQTGRLLLPEPGARGRMVPALTSIGMRFRSPTMRTQRGPTKVSRVA